MQCKVIPYHTGTTGRWVTPDMESSKDGLADHLALFALLVLMVRPYIRGLLNHQHEYVDFD